MTNTAPPSATAAPAHGPWVWLGSTRTSAFGAFQAACMGAGVEIVQAQDPRATACAVDMLTAASLSPVWDGTGSAPPPRLLLASSAEDALIAQALARPGDEVCPLDSPSEVVVARLMRIERQPVS